MARMQMHREKASLFDIVEKKNAAGAIFAHLDAGGVGLDPDVRETIERLRGAQAEANA
jgi:hypothetical protein